MSLLSLFVAARAALADRRQRQRAYEDLSALDDRSLADIGLHRSQLYQVVDRLHEAVELDAAPASVVSSVRRRNDDLPLGQQHLRRVH